MKENHTIKPPTKFENFSLRTMIIIGLGSIIYFLYPFLNKNVIENPYLFALLLFSLIFTCLKIIYEWYHYFYISILPKPVATKTYTVDIFTTFCKGEPYEMIVETLEALQAITYPHTTYLCDEADDAYLKEVCKKLGVKHITRIEKIDAKAGNINNALKYSNGELCLVLDPDHVAPPNFLDEVVAYFDNPAIGFVQVVQAYYNQADGWVAKGAAQQTYHFYGPMMMTMNKYGTVPAIGANCVFRRTALESIGGHAAGLAEDMHTAMQLHAKGWKSVFVPSMLTRGLVPSTLSAYYKQQLKWSRGVFELLFITYPTLFKQFSLRQKIHYGTIPLFYLSGLIFSINLFLPVFSLFTQEFPVKIDFSTFSLHTFPFVLSIILIRHYVQKWVIDDSERGFHLIGGILLIGTWWVFNLGFIYTLIRKDVPYIPTEKGNKTGNNFILNIPNLCVLLISISSIIYGLHCDWNPFSLIMSGITCFNILFFVLIILGSEQNRIKAWINSYHFSKIFYQKLSEFRVEFWLLRRKTYANVRSVSLLILLLFTGINLYLKQMPNELSNENISAIYTIKNPFLSGIFAPKHTDGLSSLQLVKEYQKKSNAHFDIISFYIPWGEQENCFVSIPQMDSVYSNHSIPMITWEPWQSLFQEANTFGEKKVFEHILAGKFDTYIETFALQVKQLDRPVFLRFAHEMDNPFYPWSAKGENSPEDFKNAWRYLVQKFKKLQVNNVIWVWNPWKATAMKSYFPGKSSVDWIGITALNYDTYNPQKRSYSFQEIYQPFQQDSILKANIPVMIAEMASLNNQEIWLKKAIEDIKTKFPAIKAYVIFNSGVDKNLPDGSVGLLDWRVKNMPKIKAGLSRKHLAIISNKTKNLPSVIQLDSSKMFVGQQGVNYLKANNWSKNLEPLTKKVIENDFSMMKSVGINTVKFIGGNIYDYNLLRVAQEQKLKVHFSFWLPEQLRYVNNKRELIRLKVKILETIRKYQSHPEIVSWNIANNTLPTLEQHFYKPALLYQEKAYFEFLHSLIKEIKKIDTQRPVSLDIPLSEDIDEKMKQIKQEVPEIDVFGLILSDKFDVQKQISRIELPYFFSSANPAAYLKIKQKSVGVMIENWQDQQNADLVTFNGLKDEKGRNKEVLQSLSKIWKGNVQVSRFPKIKILRPALTTFANDILPYQALVFDNENWHLAEYFKTGLSFEWYLVETNANGIAIKKQFVGTGASIKVQIPADVSRYKLLLVAIKADNITTTESILNIPL